MLMDRCNTCGFEGGHHHSRCPIGQQQSIYEQQEMGVAQASNLTREQRERVLTEQQLASLAVFDALLEEYDALGRQVFSAASDGTCKSCSRGLDDHESDGACK